MEDGEDFNVFYVEKDSGQLDERAFGANGFAPSLHIATRSYLRGVADEGAVMSVEVQGVAVDQLTVDHLPLLVEPTLGRVVAPREHDVVALESAREIIPCRRDERVFALQVLDDLVTCGLCGEERDCVLVKSHFGYIGEVFRWEMQKDLVLYMRN